MTYRQAASSLSLSSIRQQFSSPINIRVGLYGVAFLRQARDTLAVDGDAPDLTLVENGYLYLASEAGAPILAANHATQLEEGADILLLGADGLKARFPFLNLDGIAAAAWGRSGEGWFDGYMLMQAFRRKARALGVVYREGEIASIEREGARVSAVRLASGERIACGAFVNAAGASGAARLAEQMGFDIPVHSRKRCVFLFSAKERIAQLPADHRRQRRLCAHRRRILYLRHLAARGRGPRQRRFRRRYGRSSRTSSGRRSPIAFRPSKTSAPAAPGRAITI